MKTKRFKIWLLFCSSLTILAGATLAPALPSIAVHFSDLPHATFWVKTLVSIPGLTTILSATFLGLLLDRFSKKYILWISLLVYGIFGSIGFFLTENLWVILVSRIILGVAVGGVLLSVTTLAAEIYTGQKLQNYMGMQAAFGSFGAVIFLFASGILSDIKWHYVFLLHAMALFLLLSAIFIPFPNTLSTYSQKNMTPTQPSIIQLLRKRIVCGFGLLAFMEVLLLYTIALNLPFYLKARFSLESGQLGGIMAGTFFIIAASSMMYAKIKQCTLHFSRLHAFGYLSLSMGFTLIAAGNHWFLITSGLIITGVSLGILRPNLMVWIFSQCAPSIRGRMMGIMTSCFFSGQFFSPFFFQPLISHGNIHTIYWGATTCCVGIALGLWCFESRWQNSPGDRPKYFLNAKEKLGV